jgi:Mrp family chromosome partitioning ATPase
MTGVTPQYVRSARPGRELVIAHDPDNPRSEAIRSLRTELLMRSSGRRGGGIFALLSPRPQEGRSQLSAELAIAFAQLGSRTLLMDAEPTMGWVSLRCLSTAARSAHIESQGCRSWRY